MLQRIHKSDYQLQNFFKREKQRQKIRKLKSHSTSTFMIKEKKKIEVKEDNELDEAIDLQTKWSTIRQPRQDKERLREKLAANRRKQVPKFLDSNSKTKNYCVDYNLQVLQHEQDEKIFINKYKQAFDMAYAAIKNPDQLQPQSREIHRAINSTRMRVRSARSAKRDSKGPMSPPARPMTGRQERATKYQAFMQRHVSPPPAHPFERTCDYPLTQRNLDNKTLSRRIMLNQKYLNETRSDGSVMSSRPWSRQEKAKKIRMISRTLQNK